MGYVLAIEQFAKQFVIEHFAKQLHADHGLLHQ